MLKHLLTLFTLCFFIAVSAQEGEPQQKTTSRPTLTVSSVLPSVALSQQSIGATGDIAAKETATVTAQVSALTLNRILVDIGDYVEKGQLLATYDAAVVQNDIIQAEAALKQARFAAEQATQNAHRAKRLANTRAMSKIEQDNYLFQAKQAQARLDAAKAVLSNQTLRAAYTQVTAPVSGLITEKQATLGAVGNPGTPLFTLMVDGELEWLANVPDRFLSVLKKNTRANITINTGGKTVTVDGVVRSIDPTVNPTTRQGLVRVSLDKHTVLRQGLFVTGQFLLGEKKQLSLPTACIIRKDGYSYVFKVGSDNYVSREKVEVGQITGNMATILSGVSQSDQIVNSGVGFLNHGDLVKVVNTPSQQDN